MKRRLLIPAAILIVLMITNPSVKAFKEYLGRNSYAGLKRKLNFFVFSIYERGNKSYIGVIGNFIPTKSENEPDDPFAEFGVHRIDTTVFEDSSAVVTDIDTIDLPPPPPKLPKGAKEIN